jgi:hypothetical protein
VSGILFSFVKPNRVFCVFRVVVVSLASTFILRQITDRIVASDAVAVFD